MQTVYKKKRGGEYIESELQKAYQQRTTPPYAKRL